MGQVQEEQSKGILRRPVDLALVIYLTLAGFFTLFRGLVSLQWSAYFSSAPAPFPVPINHLPLTKAKRPLLACLIIREVLHPV